MSMFIVFYVLVVDDYFIIFMDISGIFEDVGFWIYEVDYGDVVIVMFLDYVENIIFFFFDVEMFGGINGFVFVCYVVKYWLYIEIVIVSGCIKLELGDMLEKVMIIGKFFLKVMVYEYLCKIFFDGKKFELLKVVV